MPCDLFQSGQLMGFFEFKVAAIRYSGPKRSDTLFHLRKHSSAEAAIKEMQKAPSSGGTTRTGEAIQYAIGEFDEKYGGRKDAKKMLIIFTDGYSQVCDFPHHSMVSVMFVLPFAFFHFAASGRISTESFELS